MEKEYIKVNREAYDVFAPQHNKRHINMGKDDVSDDEWVEILTKELGCKKDSLVLEIGPGTGRMLGILENKVGARTTAVELSKNMIEYARKRSPKTVFIEDNVLEVKFCEGSFDAIFMGALIHNFPLEDASILLDLVYKWLKKDGKALIYTTVHEKSEEGFYVKEDYSGEIVRFRKKFREDELKELLEKHNFRIIYTLHNKEEDRNKEWLTYVIEKNK